jgi:hypothetical protein
MPSLQLISLSAIYFIWKKGKWSILPVVVVLDLFIAVQLNIHATVVYPIHVSQAQKELKKTEANREAYNGDHVIEHQSPGCGLQILWDWFAIITSFCISRRGMATTRTSSMGIGI